MPKFQDHETPADLDAYFERDLILREEYAEFWQLYWKEFRNVDEQETLDEYLNRILDLEPEEWEVPDSDFSMFWRNV